MKNLLVIVIAIMCGYSVCGAVEIKNVKASHEGSLLIVTYDLRGKPGEKQAVVKVAITMNGERYRPGVITLTGDYGSNVRVGIGKKIAWNLLNDMPAGYEGKISWELNAESDGVPDPFNLLEKKQKTKPPVITEDTVGDPAAKLVWYRSVNKLQPVSTISDANALIGKMNSSNFCGFGDWRLPSKDEWESLVKLLTAYGYTSGQSMAPFMGKLGFVMPNDSKFWTRDKSSMEFTGREVFVSGTGQYVAGGSSSRSVTSSSSYRPSRYTTKTSVSSSSGAAVVSGSGSVKTRASDAGLYDVIINSKDGYFYKQQNAERAYVIPVRGDKSTELFAVVTEYEVSIKP